MITQGLVTFRLTRWFVRERVLLYLLFPTVVGSGPLGALEPVAEADN